MALCPSLDSHVQYICADSAHLCSPCAPVIAGEERKKNSSGREGAIRVRSRSTYKEGVVFGGTLGSTPSPLDGFLGKNV